MFSRCLRLLAATSVFALASAAASAQSPVPRSAPAAGAIVAAKGGEELRFVREGDWRAAELKQDLIGGDALRTNAIGNLAILFADQTQIRVGRNSTLTVNEVSSGETSTKLELQAGNVWARAARGGTGVDVKTPAAVAAIRGTDWSLAVDGSGRTSLIVLEGVVELKNQQGSVTVHRGEGAVAAIGQAPTKFVLVSPNDREQMLFYLSLRDAFTWLPATPLHGRALRAERARIETIPPAARRTDDWLSLAETAQALDGRHVAAAALAEARGRPLSRAQRARADLVEALLAGMERRWSDAAALFARAESGLDAKRRITASYGRYIAASLADPKRVLAEPKIGADTAEAALARAFVAGFRQDLNTAAELAMAAEKRFPQNTRLAVFSAQMSLALNRRDAMRTSIERVRAIDPDDHEVLLASGAIKAMVDSDRKGALADLERAAATAPGRSEIWNAVALVKSDLDAPLEAEAALRRAIEADPGDPVPYANLAILLLDQDRVDEAGVIIDAALKIDPAFHVGTIARGRYLLQKGDMAGAIESILSGSAANPAYSQGLLATAIAYYQNGDIELAEQALDNADRLDPNDPVVAIARTAVAIDQYRADDAIVFAREAVRRSRARGGDYAGLAVNRQSGSYPVEAYRFINLNEWARYYADRTFDPFAASSYFDQAGTARPNVITVKPTLNTVESGSEIDITAFNLVLQGLFFDPLAVSGRIGRIDMLRRPFLDAEVGGGLVFRGGQVGWQSDATVQGFTNSFVPTSFSLSAGRVRAAGERESDHEKADTATFFIGAAPSAADRFLVFGSASGAQPGLANLSTAGVQRFDRKEATTFQTGAGWSHTFGFRNVLTAAVFATSATERQSQQRATAGASELPALPGLPIPFTLDIFSTRKARVDGTVVAFNHTFGLGDVTLRSGIEAQRGETSALNYARLKTTLTLPDFLAQLLGLSDPVIAETTDALGREEGRFRSTRLYADALWRPADWIEAEAGVERTFLDTKGMTSDGEAASTSDANVNPRLGIAVSPAEGQWLRAAYRRDTEVPINFTLSPVGTVGLIPYALPLAADGRIDTLAARWDAEWSPRFFTALEYQRQDVRKLDLPIIDTLDTLPIEKGRIERVSATANLWLGYGIGVFGTIGATRSDIESRDGIGHDIPFVAGRFARAGLAFVHPSRLKLIVAETFVGDRTGSPAGWPLKDFWTTDAAITWETPDRRLLVGLSVLNLLDTKYDLAPGLPGPSRTVAATVKARF